MIPSLYRFPDLLRQLGPRWIAFRLGHAFRLKSGLMRLRLPSRDWSSIPLSGVLLDPEQAEPSAYSQFRRDNAPSFFFRGRPPVSTTQFQHWDSGTSSSPVERARELKGGTFYYFSHTPLAVGSPPDWHHNPLSAHQAPRDRHWSQLGDFGYGDIKGIWEISRFGFAYTLVRAYWRTGDEHFAQLFWLLFDDWRAQNPPQQGVNWKCGQETTFRVMACCFALYAFQDCQSTTPERICGMAQLIAESATRIHSDLDYALSQNNNHSISEAAGLWTAGLLFPEFKQSKQWLELGHTLLERLAGELIYEDGGFAQHSLNYQRLVIQVYLWVLRLADLNRREFSQTTRSRVAQAGSLLFDLQDEASGRVPCYGHNDGALVLPLNNCDFQDFRPITQCTSYYFKGHRCHENGPWDEDLFWLFGSEAIEAPLESRPREDLSASAGGYYTLRSEKGFAFVRCGSFKHRPAHADMLHVDLWWQGINLALDPGTYSYNAPDPWSNALSHTRFHNTVSVDEKDQMERAGRFLWLPWLTSVVRCNRRSERGRLSYWEGEHRGYQRLKDPVVHRRGILRLQEDWLVFDELAGSANHRYQLNWTLCDCPYEWEDRESLRLMTIGGDYYVRATALGAECTRTLVRAANDSPRGWQSPYYGHREPALSLQVASEGQTMLFWSSLGASISEVKVDDTKLTLLADGWKAEVHLQRDQQSTLIREVVCTGRLEDQLQL